MPEYATPIECTRREDCWFYHAMDLPSGPADGQWDLRGRFDDYTGHVPVRGKTVLDVGAATGFRSFEAEARGATVTSFDADSWTRYQEVPGAPHGHNVEVGFAQLRNGYWLSHRELGSSARVVYGDIYSLSDAVPPHEVVILGQLLVHLRDPLEGLRQAALVAQDWLVVTEGSYASPHPIASFLGGKSPHAWWHLSDTLYREWLGLLGFKVEKVTKAAYRCNAPGVGGKIELWTFAARRR